MLGATIHKLSAEVTRRVTSATPPDAIVVLGGICSVSRKHPVTRDLSLGINCPHNATLAVISKFRSLREAAHAWNPNVKIIVCELLGVNLAYANKLHGMYVHPQQQVCDKSIWAINHRIVGLNNDFQVLTPATAEICHDIDVNGERKGYTDPMQSDL